MSSGLSKTGISLCPDPTLLPQFANRPIHLGGLYGFLPAFIAISKKTFYPMQPFAGFVGHVGKSTSLD